MRVLTFDLGGISPAAQAQFRASANAMPFNPYQEPFSSQAYMSHLVKSILSEEMVKALEEMGRSAAHDILIIRNLPVDAPVPKVGDIAVRVSQKGLVSEGITLGIAGLMGCYLGQNPKEQSGKPFHNISPVKGHEHSTSSKSVDPFYLHIENPFQKEPPDFLMLIGLEGDPTAETTYFFINDIMIHIPEAVIAEMKKPQFEIRSGAGLDEVEKGIFPLIDEADGAMRIRLYESMERIRPLNESAASALSAIEEVFKSAAVQGGIKGVSLKKGEAIIFNNGWSMLPLTEYRGIMHGRRGVITNPMRWLGRSFFFRQQSRHVRAVSEGRYASIDRMLSHSRRYSLKEAADMLRAAVLESADAKTYRALHPEASDKQIALYGVHVKRSPSSWLKRILAEKETVFDGVARTLNESKSRYKIMIHKAAGKSREAAEVRGNALCQGAKALVVRAKTKKKVSQYYLTVLPADRKLDLKSLKQYLKVKDVSIVAPADAEAITGCEVGAIPPFKVDERLNLLVDPAIFDNDQIVFNAGRKDCSIFMKAADYRLCHHGAEVSISSEPVLRLAAACSR